MITSTQQVGNVIAASAFAFSSCTSHADALARHEHPRNFLADTLDTRQWFGTQAAAAQLVALNFPIAWPATAVKAANDDDIFVSLPRETTDREQVVGELRKFRVLGDDWDGEGARAPNGQSLNDAEHFLHAVGAGTPLPEPMLHATGRAGLYWNEGPLYADLEFLGDGRVSYYVERRGEGKHKGVVTIRTKEMPAVFEALLRV